MIIQFNADHSLTATEKFRTKMTATINDKMHRFSQSIKRLDVHFADENGSKSGVDDKRCLLEAHIDGRPAVVAKNHAGTYELALEGAADKLNAAIHSILGKLEDKHMRM